MSFVIYPWGVNEEVTNLKLQDLETRLSAYTDAQVASFSSSNAGVTYINGVGNGIADDRAAVAAAFTAAGTNGIVRGVPGKTYYLGSTGPIPIPSGATMLRFEGNGCTFKLSSTVPTVFRQNKTADGQTFQNFWAKDFNVDGNNVGGQYTAAVFGSDNSTYASKINFKNLRFEKIYSYNVPTGTDASPTDPNPKRSHYAFDIQDTVAGLAGTQYTSKDIYCEDLTMEGGNFGITDVGQNASGGVSGDKNIYFDRIFLNRCKWDSLTSFAGLPQSYSSGFQFGSYGYGGLLVMLRCESYRSGDVGLEINNFQRAIVRDSRFIDASQAAVLTRNYNTTWVGQTGNIARQHYTFDGCTVGSQALIPTQAQGTNNIMEGFYLATGTYDLGRVDILNCEHLVQQQLAVGSRQRAVVGGARYLHIDGLYDRRPDVQANPTANTTPNAALAIATTATLGVTKLTMRDVRVQWRGSKSGAFTYAPRMIALSGAGEIAVDASSTAEIDVTLTGVSTGMIGLSVDATTLSGSHGPVKITSLGDSTGNVGVQVTPTNCGKFVFYGADFGAWTTGTEWFVTAGAINRAVEFREPRRITHPRATSVPSITGSPQLFQNTSGQDANLICGVVGTSEVQTITMSATGGTWTASFEGQSTAALAWNITPAALQTALQGLSTIRSSDVVVTGTAGVSYTITFSGDLAWKDVAMIVLGTGSLTGGTATIAETTKGITPNISSIRRTTDGGTSFESAIAMGGLQAQIPVSNGEGWEITWTGTLLVRQNFRR